MKHLRIIRPGILDTIQDSGRHGYQYLGINPGGAMDKFASRVANILVGNGQGEAVIELHYPAGEFFFEQPALIAVSGADFDPAVNGEAIPINHPIIVRKFSVLQFKGLRSGARSYLAVRGGIGIEKWLGSYSTNLKAKAGGFKGRAFAKDDELTLTSLAPILVNFTAKDAKDAEETQSREFSVLPYYANYNYTNDTNVTNDTNEVFIVKGHEWDWLDETGIYKLLSSEFLITPNSDRMGYRLKGEGLKVEGRGQLISSAVTFGTIQLLPDGQLIILMADHQTTGGYPRIGHVISAHHSMLAQKRAGERIRFKLVELEDAKQLYINREEYLKQLEHSIKLRNEN